jgi:outer membrane murein-binding lipoprotein Lpp
MTFFNSNIVKQASVVLATIGLASLVHAEDICSPVLQTRAFNTDDYSESADVFIKKKDDLCNKTFDTEEEVKNAASSSGMDIGFKGISLATNDADQNSNRKFSLKKTDFCQLSESEVRGARSVKFKKQVTDVALATWLQCIAQTQATKLHVMYEPIDGNKGVKGQIYRTVGLQGGNTGQITGILVSQKDSSKNVTCQVGKDTLSDGAVVSISMDKVPMSFACNKPADTTIDVSFLVTTGDAPTIHMPSAERVSQTTVDHVSSTVTDLSNKLASLETRLNAVEREKKLLLEKATSLESALSDQKKAFEQVKKDIELSYVRYSVGMNLRLANRAATCLYAQNPDVQGNVDHGRCDIPNSVTWMISRP